jgi:hypothetical protein
MFLVVWINVYIIKVHAYTEDNFEHCLYQKETGLLLGDYLKELITMMMMVVMSKSPRTFVVYLYLTLGSDTTWSFSYTTSKLYAWYMHGIGWIGLMLIIVNRNVTKWFEVKAYLLLEGELGSRSISKKGLGKDDSQPRLGLPRPNPVRSYVILRPPHIIISSRYTPRPPLPTTKTTYMK